MLRYTAIALLLVASPAPAQNLLVNPDFDTDIATWSCEQSASTFTVEPATRPEVECIWSADDAEDDPNSGSGQVSLDGFSDTLIRAQIVQCVPIDDQFSYAVGAELRTIATNGRNGQLDIRWYDDAVCAGGELGLDIVDAVPASSEWTRLEDMLAAPAGAGSLKFTVIAFALEGEAHTVQVDRAFVPEPGGATPAVAWLTLVFWLRWRASPA